MKNFNVSNGVVLATVVAVPSETFCFAQNGAPGQILCHRNQGGRLSVTRNGHIVLRDDSGEFRLPAIGDKIALIRESNNPTDRSFTKAARWVPERDWEECQSAVVYAQTTFRALAYDHRNNGHFQGNTKKEVEIVQGKLLDIAINNPRRPNDPLGENYSVKFGQATLSYKVRWERQDADGKWCECGDPRPHS